MDCSAKILVLGQTGVGKSSFINYFIGKDVAATAEGRPVTTEYFDEYVYEGGKYPIHIFDTKGLEVLDANNQVETLKEEISKRNNNEDSMNWFHTIFYCVAMGKRFEDFEVDFIKSLRNKISQHIHIILTNCDAVSAETIENMKKRIYDKLDYKENIKIFEVVSIEKKKRNGDIVKKSGKEAIVESVFELLWSDISNKIALKYAGEARKKAKDVINSTFDEANKLIDKIFSLDGYLKFAKDVIKNETYLYEEIDKLFNDADKRFDKQMEEMENELKKVVKPISELYISYKNIIYIHENPVFYRLKFKDVFASVDQEIETFSIDGITVKLYPNLKKLNAAVVKYFAYEFNNIDNVKAILKNIKNFIVLNKKFKKQLKKLRKKSLEKIPDKEIIFNDIYNKLIEIVDTAKQ